MTEKPEELHEQRTVVYSEDKWELLAHLRERALQVLEKAKSVNIRGWAYGSLARGDVTESSDIDIIIPYVVPSYKIEMVLGRGILREIVQATPSSVLKAHIHLDQKTVISFPLFKMMSREIEFYKWGGQVDEEKIASKKRVPGVDKRLILIQPTQKGHIESGVIGYENRVAKKLGVSPSVAKERVRVLTRRDEVGRTGVYLSKVVEENRSFEEVAKQLIDRDPAIRRTMKRRA
ncbi:nucleotidyltransferase [Candidatus Thorarchaeota archaeon]|nr:MAG: nucleotidyltransferase [Candidatus Thorarchaeota archaeon]